MAAEFESGLFVAREAWHKQGVVLEKAPNPLDAYAISGLDWKVDKRPLFTNFNGMKKTDMFAITRSKDNRILGYCKDQYKTYQNIRAFEWTVPLIESGRWSIETCGSLKEGEICWILLKQNEYEITKGDVLKEYLLLTWAHDCEHKNIIQPTTIRVVCNNTLQASLSGANTVGIRHSSKTEKHMEFVQNLFVKSEEQFENQMKIFEKLLNKTLSDNLIEQFIDQNYSAPEDATLNKKTICKKKVNFLKEMAFGKASGIIELGIKNTAWGLFNAITEANEHYLVSSKSDSGMNILFGKGKKENETVLRNVVDFCQLAA